LPQDTIIANLKTKYEKIEAQKDQEYNLKLKKMEQKINGGKQILKQTKGTLLKFKSQISTFGEK